ncbi:MAG: hypothetical protein GY847_16810 [Proteobacteria bacterium]|nr:hypothetical protein [Pseudomonadota bacterium]
MIEIHCPLCGQVHEYPETINRSGILYGGISVVSEPKEYMRVFTCPDKKQTFEMLMQEKSIEDKLRDEGIY